MKYIESFKKFVIDYEPFDWEKQDKSLYHDKKFVHSLETSFKRFYKVYFYLKKIELLDKTKKRIVDVGAYPGNMLKLCKHIFGKNISYFAVGLGFSKSYKNTMKKFNANTIETELDPTFPYAKKVNKWRTKNNNICLLLDVIEHLVDPVHCLDEINKSLKKNGYLIITTDNISNFRYIINMFFSGKSPNIHPLRSSLIYTGDWRPHFREYSKDELFFYLDYCGYAVIEHEYFDREMGNYFINEKKQKINKVYSFKSIRNFLSFFIIKITNLIPHFRSHHIILAQKKREDSKLKKSRIKTDDKLEWLKIRKKYNLD
tara:strand:- start:20356 stop:21300 length:945 start_codon:yes stop_codon:yes gene_type:complete